MRTTTIYFNDCTTISMSANSKYKSKILDFLLRLYKGRVKKVENNCSNKK